jgi:hypothetical protein
MGVKGSQDNTTVLSRIKFPTLLQLLQHHHRNNRNNNNEHHVWYTSPTIDFDVSWMAQKHPGTVIDRAEKIKEIASLLANNNINVVIVCDAEWRHHSKRASTMRQSTHYKNKVYLKKMQLMKVTKDKLRCRDTNELLALSNKEAKLAEYITKSEAPEQKSNIDTGDYFYDALCDVVQLENDNNASLKRNNPTITRGFISEFQADAALAHWAINKLSDVTVSADSDLAVLVGPSCCLVKDYKYNSRQNKGEPMHSIYMVFSSMIVLEELLDNMAINPAMQKITPSKHPFF